MNVMIEDYTDGRRRHLNTLVQGSSQTCPILTYIQDLMVHQLQKCRVQKHSTIVSQMHDQQETT